MVQDHDKNKIKTDLAIVRDVLMREWDPIGVNSVVEAKDEYDRYADRVYSMLINERANQEVIAAYLYDIANNHMGLGSSIEGLEACKRTAEILVSMRPKFETH